MAKMMELILYLLMSANIVRVSNTFSKYQSYFWWVAALICHYPERTCESARIEFKFDRSRVDKLRMNFSLHFRLVREMILSSFSHENCSLNELHFIKSIRFPRSVKRIPLIYSVEVLLTWWNFCVVRWVHQISMASSRRTIWWVCQSNTINFQWWQLNEMSWMKWIADNLPQIAWNFIVEIPAGISELNHQNRFDQNPQCELAVITWGIKCNGESAKTILSLRLIQTSFWSTMLQ